MLLLAMGCGGSNAPSPGPNSTATSGAVTATIVPTFAAQVERGATLYGTHCAACHGNQGQGGDKAPPLVGPAALPLLAAAGAKRTVEFRTALDVFLWVKAHMPGDAPGSLSDEQYVDILAFDLKANGVDLSPGHLDGESAKGVVLHE